MPTASDLVTDLPADFETFGQAVATSMADLLGGTTGQVLSKASNTDMDFTWVTTDDANAIQNSIVDAKGDLVAASANDTPARLAVGNNGETLVADSSTSTGLRYNPPVQQNPILNSSFQVWQRGTSFAFQSGLGAPAYTADQYQCYRGGGALGATMSRVATGDTTNLPNIQYAARVQRNSGNTSTADLYLFQTMETVNSIPFTGKTVTFSFYARAGANYSATSSFLNAQVIYGTGTDQNALAGFTGRTGVISQNATLTTTWQRFSYTATVATASTQLGFYFAATPTGTAGANDYFEVTGIQLELGSVATPFKTYAGTIQGELAACQRYYIRYSSNGDSNFDLIGPFGSAAGTTQAFISWNTPTMRIAASAVDYANLRLSDNSGGTPAISNLVLIVNSNPTTQIIEVTTSGATAYRPYLLQANNNATAYIGFSAEL
jgi:hypothetical protein